MNPSRVQNLARRWFSILMVAGSLTVCVFPRTTLAEAPNPTLYLIGDSTVKTGRGTGEGGQWGWGQVIDRHFDEQKVRVVNQAIGGRSSRTFLTEGRWENVLKALKPGDFVMMQFGHNDGGQTFRGSRPRASIKGNGDETRDGVVEQTGKSETVHSYGWYLRRYIGDTQAKGATPIVLSPIPRNIWRDGKVARASQDYGRWARQAAEAHDAYFIDLNELVAQRYEADGSNVVGSDYFTPADHTHTSKRGAEVNAECVVQGLRALRACDLRELLLDTDQETTTVATRNIWRFDFGDADPAPGSTAISPLDLYSDERGFGFEANSRMTVDVSANTSGDVLDDSIMGDTAFYFSVELPEGNYRITLTTGSPKGKTRTTVKAELRRLMIEGVQTEIGQFAMSTFVVNVRTPRIDDSREVRLKDRERAQEWRAWDNRLTLEFNDQQPAVAAIEIERVENLPVCFIIGDSTVCDQPSEDFASRGQMITRFFKSDIVLANHGESGESYRGSFGAGRFDKIFSQMKMGDYLIMQFGHNDMKSVDEASYAGSIRRAVATCRECGGVPIVVSPMERRGFDEQGRARESLRGFPAAAKSTAEELDVAFIDLHS